MWQSLALCYEICTLQQKLSSFAIWRMSHPRLDTPLLNRASQWMETFPSWEGTHMVWNPSHWPVTFWSHRSPRDTPV